MLQLALLLLGCALSRYLWEINMTVASVIIGVTGFGLASYAFFIVAGTVSTSCPYQTPGAHFLRHLLSVLRSASSNSISIMVLSLWWHSLKASRLSVGGIFKISISTLLLPIYLLMDLVIDAYFLAREFVRVVVARALRARGLDPQAALDQRCILWILQTSLDKNILLPTLRSLATMTTLADLDPALISVCFDILAGCVSIVGNKAAILQGSEELTAASTLCCLRILPQLTAGGPASNNFEDVRRRYTKTFPMEADFRGLPSYHRFCIIHNVFHPSWKSIRSSDPSLNGDFFRPKIQWKDYRLSSAEHVVITHLAVAMYRRKRYWKVPRWILRYGQHLLSRDTLPSDAVVADCLSIIAMDLCYVIPTRTTHNERYVRT